MLASGIVGICRFSFLGLCDWSAYGESRETGVISEELLAEVAAKLYDSKRLEARFKIFETLLIPSIKAQTDQNFRFLVITSPQMPEKYLSRLEGILARVPNAQLIVENARSTWDAIVPELENIKQSWGGTPLQFRIDDDDCLSVHFIDELRKAMHSMARYDRYAVSMPRNLLMTSYGDDGQHFAEDMALFHSAGCAYLDDYDINTTVYNFAHHLMWKEVPSIILPHITSCMMTKTDGHDAQGNDQNRYVDITKNHAISKERLLELYKYDFPFLNYDEDGKIIFKD
ncbi:hypothetical protein LMG33818_001646 [Halomonadaceae bacterium LMG 33818]|uniref:glycosyltransferase n=1 Tax=Cernens ardua TaxID=3402176 RepID=UPI003EDBEA69